MDVDIKSTGIIFGRFVMADFRGVNCPICNDTFDEDSDIVVCPDCGAPYHRECYKQKGHCVFEDKHKDNENWQADYKQDEQIKPKVCKNCKHNNTADAKFCEKCGFPFNLNVDFNFSQESYTKSEASSHDNDNKFPGGSFFSFVLDRLGGVNKNENFDGVSADELADFIGNSSRYYLPEFKRIKEGGKTKFNFAAFVFSSYWFFYRKQYKWGIIASIVLTIFSIYDIICNLAYIVDPSYQITKTGVIISYVCYFLYISCKVLVSIFANKIYYKHCIKKVKKIKSISPTIDAYRSNLKTKGNVSILAASLVGMLSVVLMYGAMYFFS